MIEPLIAMCKVWGKKHEKDKGSEFGKGLVLCLCKFAEHNYELERWVKLYEYMRTQYAGEDGVRLFGETTAVEMWANGASDHLYEIEVPTRMIVRLTGAVESLKQAIQMGHGYTGEDYKWYHGAEVRWHAEWAASLIGIIPYALVKLSDRFSIHRLRPIDERGTPKRSLFWKIRAFVHRFMLRLIHRLAWLYDIMMGLKPDIGRW